MQSKWTDNKLGKSYETVVIFNLLKSQHNAETIVGRWVQLILWRNRLALILERCGCTHGEDLIERQRLGGNYSLFNLYLIHFI